MNCEFTIRCGLCEIAENKKQRKSHVSLCIYQDFSGITLEAAYEKFMVHVVKEHNERVEATWRPLRMTYYPDKVRP